MDERTGRFPDPPPEQASHPVPATSGAPYQAPVPEAIAVRTGGVGPTDYESVLASAGALLDDVDLALQRLDEGTYRTCEVCGGVIGEARLGGHPTTRTCEAHPR